MSLSRIQWLNLAASRLLSRRHLRHGIEHSLAGADPLGGLPDPAHRKALSKILAQGDRPEPMVAKWLSWSEGSQRHVLLLGDAAFPRRLAEIPDAPVVLFCEGATPLLERPQVAIVGTRHPTAAGREDAGRFARALCERGLVITSGLAAGIDAAAHAAALASGGTTIAVLGCGIDRCYPAMHQSLQDRIREQGLLVSEYPPGTPPRPHQFPVRNRIISGLSLGTLVIEASLNSGSLITARLALEQNREVFAMPGSIHNPAARGCHRLIRDGAKLVETVSDVCEELHDLVEVWPAVPVTRSVTVEASGLGASAREVFEQVDWYPSSLALLAERSRLAPSTIAGALSELLLHGLIVEDDQGYRRASETT